MNTLLGFVSFIWLFLSSIYQVATLTFQQFIDGFTLVVNNPFNDNTWTISNKLSFVSDVLEWLVDTLGVPTDTTVFGALLFAFVLTFVIVCVVRLFSFVTPD